jgi:hypothetical protein
LADGGSKNRTKSNKNRDGLIVDRNTEVGIPSVMMTNFSLLPSHSDHTNRSANLLGDTTGLGIIEFEDVGVSALNPRR